MISKQLFHIANLIEKTAKGTLSFNGRFFVFRYKAVWGEGGGTELDAQMKEFSDKLTEAVDEFNKANKSKLKVNKGTIVNSHYGMMAEINVTGAEADKEIVKKFSDFMRGKGFKVK